jgi:hypothetical protein
MKGRKKERVKNVEEDKTNKGLRIWREERRQERYENVEEKENTKKGLRIWKRREEERKG